MAVSDADKKLIDEQRNPKNPPKALPTAKPTPDAAPIAKPNQVTTSGTPAADNDQIKDSYNIKPSFTGMNKDERKAYSDSVEERRASIYGHPESDPDVLAKYGNPLPNTELYVSTDGKTHYWVGPADNGSRWFKNVRPADSPTVVEPKDMGPNESKQLLEAEDYLKDKPYNPFEVNKPWYTSNGKPIPVANWTPGMLRNAANIQAEWDRQQQLHGNEIGPVQERFEGAINGVNALESLRKIANDKKNGFGGDAKELEDYLDRIANNNTIGADPDKWKHAQDFLSQLRLTESNMEGINKVDQKYPGQNLMLTASNIANAIASNTTTEIPGGKIVPATAATIGTVLNDFSGAHINVKGLLSVIDGMQDSLKQTSAETMGSLTANKFPIVEPMRNIVADWGHDLDKRGYGYGKSVWDRPDVPTQTTTGSPQWGGTVKEPPRLPGMGGGMGGSGTPGGLNVGNFLGQAWNQISQAWSHPKAAPIAPQDTQIPPVATPTPSPKKTSMLGTETPADTANTQGNVEVANYAPELPTLARQEHVDALAPGSPFKWSDGQNYVKV